MRKMSAEKDWRLRIDLQEPVDLDGLVTRARNSAGESMHRSTLSDDIVLTHDGSTVFAYAPNENVIRDARDAIQSAIGGQRTATVRVSHWEPSRRQWHQTDPPLTYEEDDGVAAAARASDDRTETADEATETRPVVCVIGKLIRKSFEAQMLAAAQNLRVEMRHRRAPPSALDTGRLQRDRPNKCVGQVCHLSQERSKVLDPTGPGTRPVRTTVVPHPTVTRVPTHTECPGLLTLPARARSSRRARVNARGSVSDLVAEQRR